MKGISTQAVVIAVSIGLIALLIIFSFRTTIKRNMDAWRLVRISMVHAHLMASEYMQDEIGVVNPSSFETLKSMGYRVSAALYDPERNEIIEGPSQIAIGISSTDEDVQLDVKYEDGMTMPRNFMGHFRLNDSSKWW